jgi:hypothetical protein
VVASSSSRNALVLFTGIATVNKEMYIDILRRLRDAVRRKRPEKWRTNSWFLLHENALAHRSVLVTDFLAKSNVTTLEHLLTGSSRCLPVPWTEFSVERMALLNATAIIKNATEELKRLLQNGLFKTRL